MKERWHRSNLKIKSIFGCVRLANGCLLLLCCLFDDLKFIYFLFAITEVIDRRPKMQTNLSTDTNNANNKMDNNNRIRFFYSVLSVVFDKIVKSEEHRPMENKNCVINRNSSSICLPTESFVRDKKRHLPFERLPQHIDLKLQVIPWNCTSWIESVNGISYSTEWDDCTWARVWMCLGHGGRRSQSNIEKSVRIICLDLFVIFFVLLLLLMLLLLNG